MNRHKDLQALCCVALLATTIACAPREEPAEGVTPDRDAGAAAVEPEPDAAAAPEPARARAELQAAPGSGVSGSVEVTDQAGGAQVVAHVTGVEQPGPHGIHVHEVGSCEPPDFSSAGGHLNPTGAPHACPPTTPRHAGDLGNIEIAEGGEGHLEQMTDLLTVASGPSSVVGRAIVLHSGVDDCTTQPSGGSGDPLACGVFERAD